MREAIGGPDGLESIVSVVQSPPSDPEGPVQLPRELYGPFVVQLEYDDGNGMWISSHLHMD